LRAGKQVDRTIVLKFCWKEKVPAVLPRSLIDSYYVYMDTRPVSLSATWNRVHAQKAAQCFLSTETEFTAGFNNQRRTENWRVLKAFSVREKSGRVKS
jgi:hypothetical protein